MKNHAALASLFRKISSRAVVFAAVCMTIGCTAGSAAASVPESAYRISASKWLNEYIAYFQAHHLPVSPSFSAPGIWLFSPEGAMVKVVEVDDDPQLDKLKSAFPLPAGSPQIADMPSLKQTDELLSHALATEVATDKDKGSWVAVLFLSDSSDCAHCVLYDKELAGLAQRSSSPLKVVRVTATF